MSKKTGNGLSSGTLSLKFMQRRAPAAAFEATTATADSVPSMSSAEWVIPGRQHVSGKSENDTQPVIEYEASYLPFLFQKSPRTHASAPGNSGSAYSTQPKGRRKFREGVEDVAIEAPMLAPTPAPDQSVTTKSPKPERGARKDYTKRTRDYPPTQPAQAVPPTSNVFLPPSGVEAPSKPFARPVVARDSDEDEVDNLIGEVLSTAVQEKKKPKRERSVGDLNLAGTESSRRRRK